MVVILFGGYIMQSIRNTITAIVIIFSILNCSSKIFAATAMKNRQRLIKESGRNFSSAKTEKKRKEIDATEETKNLDYKIACRIYRLLDVAKRLKYEIYPIEMEEKEASSITTKEKATYGAREEILRWLQIERNRITYTTTDGDSILKYVKNPKTKRSFTLAQKIIAHTTPALVIAHEINDQKNIGVVRERSEQQKKDSRPTKKIKPTKTIQEIREECKLELTDTEKKLGSLYKKIVEKNYRNDDNSQIKFLDECLEELRALKSIIGKITIKAHTYNFTEYKPKRFLNVISEIYRIIYLRRVRIGQAKAA